MSPGDSADTQEKFSSFLGYRMKVSIEPDVLSQSMEEPVIGRRRLKVLLVEDYPTVRNAIVKVLKSIHLEVVEAKNGIEALQVLDSQSVDMVFTDLVMPEMDGFGH